MTVQTIDITPTCETIVRLHDEMGLNIERDENYAACLIAVKKGMGHLRANQIYVTLHEVKDELE